MLINYGEFNGKLATVIDAVDSKRVLVDGPQGITGVHRHVIGLKRISLTDVVVKGTYLYYIICHSLTLTQSLAHLLAYSRLFFYSLTHSITHLLIQSLTHSITHSITHSLNHSLT